MLSPKALTGIVFCLGLMLLALPAISKEKIAESQWATLPVAIDGLAEDWSGATFLDEAGAGADLAFRNDADYLYLLLIIKDKQHLSSFDLTGISIYFSGEGKKNKDRRLHFYRKIAAGEEVVQALEQSGQTLTEERKAELLSRKNYILYQGEWVVGKQATPVAVAPSAQLLPPMFKAHAEGEKTAFEFRLPLSRESQAWGLGAVPGGTLKIGLAWGGLTEEMKARRMNRMMAAQEREAMPGSPDTDYVDRGIRTQQDISNEMRTAPPKEYSFWLDVKLAKAE